MTLTHLIERCESGETRTLRPDQQPGFWPAYREPSLIGEAIQYPLADPYWQNRVMNAYRKLRSLSVLENRSAPLADANNGDHP